MTTNAITCHHDGRVSHAAGERQATIPAHVWGACSTGERERVARTLRGLGVRVTISGSGDVTLGETDHCGLSYRQALLLMRASRANMRKGVAA